MESKRWWLASTGRLRHCPTQSDARTLLESQPAPQQVLASCKGARAHLPAHSTKAFCPMASSGGHRRARSGAVSASNSARVTSVRNPGPPCKAPLLQENVAALQC